jgi:hypothetical protein
MTRSRPITFLAGAGGLTASRLGTSLRLGGAARQVTYRGHRLHAPPARCKDPPIDTRNSQMSPHLYRLLMDRKQANQRRLAASPHTRRTATDQPAPPALSTARRTEKNHEYS